jgi:hypothetical protein
VNHLEHSIEALYDTSIKKLRRREEDIHNKTRVTAIIKGKRYFTIRFERTKDIKPCSAFKFGPLETKSGGQ